MNTKIKQFLFDKTRCYLSDRDGRVESQRQALSYYKNQLIIPRAKSVYTTFSVASIPKSDLNAYAANQVMAFSPFKSSGFYVCYKHDTAMLWIWDSEYELGLLEQFGLTYTDTDILPETVLYPPGTNNFLLVACKLGGFEGQVWKGDVLTGSRYWIKQPVNTQLADFARTFNVARESLVNGVAEGEFLPLPWYEKQWSFLLKREFIDSALPSIVSTLLFIYLGWQVANYAVLSGLYAYKESQLESKQVAVEATLNSRQQALRFNQQNRELNATVTQPQLALLYDFVEKLTDDVDDLRAWKFQGNELNVEISVSGSSALDVATLVSNAEELTFISSVSVRRLGTLGNRWEITAEVNL